MSEQSSLIDKLSAQVDSLIEKYQTLQSNNTALEGEIAVLKSQLETNGSQTDHVDTSIERLLGKVQAALPSDPNELAVVHPQASMFELRDA